MTIECSQCGSIEFKKLSLVHAEGVSTLKARSRGLGLLFGSGGGDILVGRARTKGEIQTRLSRQASPPRKWSYWKIFVYGLIGLPVLDFVLAITTDLLPFAGNFPRQLNWFGSGYLIVLALILALAGWHNLWAFPKRYRLWDRSFLCRTCGHIMQLSRSGASASQAIVREGEQ